MSGDTIVAVATPMGLGAVGLVRLSGPAATAVAGRLFRPDFHANIQDAPARRPLKGQIVDPADGTVVDEVLVTLFPAPFSYTGEDVVEISGHGGPVVVSIILRLALAHGARLGEPGEFTRRAFLNGKLDLAQAEAVLDVITAQTEMSHRAAVAHLTGAFSRGVEALREGLLAVLARLEVAMDFPEEDGADPAAGELAASLEPIRAAIADRAASFARGRLLRSGIAVALVGRPNVGKSSLLNALLGAPRAIVTPEPGTTRDVIEEPASIGGLPVRLMDTAGLRDVDGRAEAEGVRRAEETLAEADCVLVIIDASEPLSADDERDMTALADPLRARRPVILCLNKSDLPPAVDSQELEALAPGLERMSVSALTGQGVEGLRRRIAELIMGGEAVSGGEPLVMRERHRHALLEAEEAVARAMEAASSGRPLELTTSDLRGACEALGRITGTAYTEDLLDAIFRDFCLGK